jgi:hypothetical protein
MVDDKFIQCFSKYNKFLLFKTLFYLFVSLCLVLDPRLLLLASLQMYLQKSEKHTKCVSL